MFWRIPAPSRMRSRDRLAGLSAGLANAGLFSSGIPRGAQSALRIGTPLRLAVCPTPITPLYTAPMCRSLSTSRTATGPFSNLFNWGSSGPKSPLYSLRSASIRADANRGNFTYINRIAVALCISALALTVSVASSFYLLFDYIETELSPIDDTSGRVKDPARKYLLSAAIREQILPSSDSALLYLQRARTMLLKEQGFTERDPVIVEITQRIAEHMDLQGRLIEAAREYTKVWDYHVGSGDTEPSTEPKPLDAANLVFKIRLALQFGAVNVGLTRWDAAKAQLGAGLLWISQLNSLVEAESATSRGTGNPWHTSIRQGGRPVIYNIHDVHLMEIRIIERLGDTYALQSQLPAAQRLYSDALTKYHSYRALRDQAIQRGDLQLPTWRSVPHHWLWLNDEVYNGQIDLAGFYFPPVAAVASLSRRRSMAKDHNKYPVVDPWVCVDAQLMDHLGEIKYGLGQREDADSWLASSRGVVERNSGIPACDSCAAVIYSHIARISEFNNQPEAAMAHWLVASRKAEAAKDAVLMEKCNRNLFQLQIAHSKSKKSSDPAKK
ncbi:hypothetical protein BJ085DRAFT_28820 [Dimargaris cristalligena]|uniref:Uncharacterized protein n=1 Tax=Dimargaris cristalligena TaxID=215637 RepID=A0A4P9ZMY7_9FUNG|nr:hypothetical protein BJ085DRAFT_28820 [Dimargaris cristalligena]|eukprot:RKP34458.1 hypothetical protein BJ085DRAFT_28820 [Dimargaris cristalligena]